MGCKTLCFGLTCILFAYYIYTPLPENIEEPWKVGIIDAFMKTASLTCIILENMGLLRYEEALYMLVKLDQTAPISDENVTVIDTNFADIPVHLYLPKKSESQRRAIIFIHGGGFVVGRYSQRAWDFLNRWTANKLDAVVVSTDYRLAPHYQFPASLEDVVSVVKFFLQDKILAKYGVDPSRIRISGDSSGGGLTATVTQLVQYDPDFKNKIKAQALIYPGLQLVDTLTPSFQEYEHGPILSRIMTIKMEYLYFTKDKALLQALKENQHMPRGSRHLFTLANWSTLLPEKYRRNHIYTEPIIGRLNSSYTGLSDSRSSPLLVNDSQLQNLPLTYILTCEHDVGRDDGLMYVSRLRNAAVNISHDHLEDGVHGAISFMTIPFYLRIGIRIRDKYVSWLEENL